MELLELTTNPPHHPGVRGVGDSVRSPNWIIVVVFILYLFSQLTLIITSS
jgi:hypothetical protein